MYGACSGIVSKDVSRTIGQEIPRRYLALWLPFLATDRLHRQRILMNGAEPDNRPRVQVEKVKGALRITAVDQRAAKCALVPGLTLADARARIPDLAVDEADATSDARSIAELAEYCHRFTPSVALDLHNGLMLDITGCAHLFGGEAALQKKVADDLRRIGFSLRSSVAGTPDAARALARFSNIDIAPIGRDEPLVKRLPVAALSGLERDAIVSLSRAGLKTIGDLAERPPQVLAARFGQGIVTCLMRTLGREDARITPLRPVPSIVVERHFAEPFTQMDAVEGILSSLLEEAQSIMQERDEGGRIFETSFFRSDGAVRHLAVQTGRPCRDVAAVLRLYRERLHTVSDPIDPGFGFDSMRLAVPVTEKLSAEQAHLDAGRSDIQARDDAAIADLIDRLVVRFGQSRVLRFEPRDTHDPDNDARLVPAAEIQTQRCRSAAMQPDALNATWSSREPGEPPRRPLQLFARPQQIEALAEVPDGPPLRFRWRRVLHEVARSEGPERIEPEWWRTDRGAQTRDYYRVEDTAGCRFWIFRQGHYGDSDVRPRWFVHGLFA